MEGAHFRIAGPVSASWRVAGQTPWSVGSVAAGKGLKLTQGLSFPVGLGYEFAAPLREVCMKGSRNQKENLK